MNRFRHRNLWSLALVTLLGIGFAAQTYQVYELNRKVARLEEKAGTISDGWGGTSAAPGALQTDPWELFNGRDPFAGMRQLQRQMDSLFGPALPGRRLSPASFGRAGPSHRHRRFVR